MLARSTGRWRHANSNFDALRIFAVLVVLYGNGYILTGALAPGLWGEPFFLIGLHLLFAISGFLLADSWQRDPDWCRYAIRRALRLLPGLFAAVLLTVLVIGPLATRLSLRFYLLNGQTFRYFANFVLIQQRTLPRVFEGQQWSGSVNPMLWTLLAGSLLAACVPLATVLPARLRPLALLAVCLVVGGLSQFLAPFPDGRWFQFLPLEVRLVLAEAPFFLAGMAWRHLDRGDGSAFRADVAMLCFAANWLVASWWSDWAVPLLWLTVPYMAACFGRRSAPLLRRLPNISYGMYLIAFPVQQSIVSLFPRFAHPIIACTLAAALLGILFWFLVERPALRLGRRRLLVPPAASVLASAQVAPRRCECTPQPHASPPGSPRDNNFDALRIFAAILVIYGHGRDLAGGADPGLWGEPLARIGLDIFFSISGFLVTTSWERDPRPLAFLAKRALRIFPGLIVCILVTAFLLGPAVSTMSPGAYFSSPGTYTYLANMALYARQHLPGVFTTLQHGAAVNGSLWSLFPEWLCYLTVPLSALLTRRLRACALSVAALACGGIGVLLFLAPADRQIVFYGASLHYMLVQVPLFLMGGLFGLMRRRNGLLGGADLCLLFLTLNFGISTWFGWWSLPIEWLTMPYMVISFGLLSLPGLNRVGRFGDLSYGLYLYAFPMQQLVLYFLPGIQAPIAACTLLTLLIALLSWHLVEKPALRLKPGTPSDGAGGPSKPWRLGLHTLKTAAKPSSSLGCGVKS
ncbi:acyltransferase family protein [Rhodopila sp.]|uniref:acyltransferase family protein n=1 Tax=Rhodopila sp. TaxID=2480087 RepID=UPI003D124CB0